MSRTVAQARSGWGVRITPVGDTAQVPVEDDDAELAAPRVVRAAESFPQGGVGSVAAEGRQDVV
jgi:hypothetical protein